MLSELPKGGIRLVQALILSSHLLGSLSATAKLRS